MNKEIALIGMCDPDYVDELLDEIRNRKAREYLFWPPCVDDDYRKRVEMQIEEQFHFRLFMYEKKTLGGVGIRLAAHLDEFRDVAVKKCYKNRTCKSRFRVKGYELFDPPLDLTDFRSYDEEDQFPSPRGLGQSFGYVKNTKEVIGIDSTIFTKLVWNSDGWQAPTGDMTENKKGYYKDYGFAHEEWNFRFEHFIGDTIYGFMMGRPKGFGTLGTYPVYFYSPNNGRFYLTGAYLDSQRASQDEIDGVNKEHKKRGIIDERANEVFRVVEYRSVFGPRQNFGRLPLAEKKKIILAELGNEGYKARNYLKCPKKSAILLPEPIEIDDYLLSMMREKRGFDKYDIPLYLRVYPVVLNTRSFSDEPVGENDIDDSADSLSHAVDKMVESGTIEPYDSSEVTYHMKSCSSKYQKKEFELVNEFRSWLLERFKIESRKESDSIDTVFCYEGFKYGVEAKYSEGKMRFPMRSAIGQILEYNFYPGRNPKDRWIVLLNRRPVKEEREWFERIEVGVELVICWKGTDGFAFQDGFSL